MAFNQYAWDLYKNSYDGKTKIEFLSEADGYTLFSKYYPRADSVLPNVYNDWLENIYCYGLSDYEQPNSLEDAKNIYYSLISLGIRIENKQWIYREDFKEILKLTQPISYVLSRFSSEYFFPYLFLCRMFELNRIVDTFDIDLPKIPKRIDYKSRCLYYWELCEIMYKFRKENGLSAVELWAFLYDFAPKLMGKAKDGDIPQPAQAWFIGGKLYEKFKMSDVKFWQSNPDTKKGDILLYYEKAPISALICIEIAQTDGIIDPIYYYYGNTYIGNRIDIPYITLKELQKNAYFSQHALVRGNLQGVNGRQASGEDYAEILRILQSKGFDTDKLPKLYASTLPKDVIIQNERDVEIKLLEPILNEMGWYEHHDFIRQLPIHAGRGHRIYPDYALHYSNKSGEEKAKVLIEAKLYMKSNRDIENAFLRARSYAYLLSSSIIVLCDKFCLIVYDKKEGFDRNRYTKYYWSELENPDTFNELKNKLN